MDMVPNSIYSFSVQCIWILIFELGVQYQWEFTATKVDKHKVSRSTYVININKENLIFYKIKKDSLWQYMSEMSF
jgi:23S rRNA A1618 N6-methylase RlmF